MMKDHSNLSNGMTEKIACSRVVRSGSQALSMINCSKLCATRTEENEGTETAAPNKYGWVEKKFVAYKLGLDFHTKNETTYIDAAVHRNPFHL